MWLVVKNDLPAGEQAMAVGEEVSLGGGEGKRSRLAILNEVLRGGQG